MATGIFKTVLNGKKVRRGGRDYLRKLKIPAGETSYQSIYKEKDLRKT